MLPDTSGLSSLICPSCGRHLEAQKIEPFGEADWLVCNDPMTLACCRPSWPSDRKRRLFVCACCRLFWRDLSDPGSRQAVELAEKLADGLVNDDETAEARTAARAASAHYPYGGHPTFVAAMTLEQQPSPARAVEALRRYYRNTWRKDSPRIAALFRDIAGNPFRPPRPLSAAVLTWSDGTVVRLARAIDEVRAFDRLPILADALEEAGCHDADLLGHCRRAGPHVKGCWAVAAILGRE